MRPADDHLDVARYASPDGLLDLTVFSHALNRRVDVTLYRAGACGEVSPGSEIPVVILLHGVYGSHWSWARSGRAHETLQRIVSSGEAGQCILAMPSDGMRGVGSGYLDRPGEDCESWIVNELPGVVRRVWSDASTTSVAIAGLSMGGWGALRLAARNPGRFISAAGMSPLTHVDQIAGYAEPDRQAEHAAPWVDSPRLLDALVSATGPLPPIRITCGTEDDLITPVRALHKALVDHGIDHEYADGPGGHTWDYWSQDLADVLRFFDRSFRTA